ncbi:MAG: hypothetical protein ACRYHQ_27830 [Janthinobacterium lividum]
MKKIALSLALVSGLGLSACSDPYDPGQRALGGAGIGALGGAALGGALGGGRGAAIGALGGAGVGAATGAVSTPSRPYYQQQQPYYQPRPYGY